MKLFILSLFITSSLMAATWKPLLKQGNIELFHKGEIVDGMIPFKAIGIVDAPIEKVTQLLFDYKIKNTWVPKLKVVKLHEVKANHQFIVSEYYSTPWPFYDREFLLLGSIYKKGEEIYFIGQDAKEKKYADDKHVLVNVQKLDVILRPKNKQTEIEFIFVGNMGGVIPLWISRLIQKRWPLRFIQKIESHIKNNEIRETKEYLEFKRKYL